MAIIKKIFQKSSDGSFISSYNIGAEATNVTMANGVSLEDTVTELSDSFITLEKTEANDVVSLISQINSRALSSHAFDTPINGLATSTLYGHVKIMEGLSALSMSTFSGTAFAHSNGVYLYNLIGNIKQSIYDTGWKSLSYPGTIYFAGSSVPFGLRQVGQRVELRGRLSYAALASIVLSSTYAPKYDLLFQKIYMTGSSTGSGYISGVNYWVTSSGVLSMKLIYGNMPSTIGTPDAGIIDLTGISWFIN